MRPRFSIVMPVRNGEAFIANAIESVLEQTFGDFELLVSDDDSTDGTLGIVSALASRDLRIRLLRHKPSGWAGGNRNYAMRQVRAEWIAFLDADDLWPSNHLALCVAAIEACPDAVIFFGDLQRFVNSTADAQPSVYDTKGFFAHDAPYVERMLTVGDGIEIARCHSHELIKHSCLRYCPIITGGVTLRRKTIDENHLSFKDEWRINEDFDLWMNVLEHGPGVAIHRALHFYRENPAGLSGDGIRYVEGMAQCHTAWAARIASRLTEAERALYRDKVAGFLQSLAWEHSCRGHVVPAVWAQLRSLRYRRHLADILTVAKRALSATYYRLTVRRRNGLAS